jgi:hypothetical protein
MQVRHLEKILLSIHDHEQSCFEVENATEHELFHDNPLVVETQI